MGHRPQSTLSFSICCSCCPAPSWLQVSTSVCMEEQSVYYFHSLIEAQATQKPTVFLFPPCLPFHDVPRCSPASLPAELSHCAHILHSSHALAGPHVCLASSLYLFAVLHRRESRSSSSCFFPSFRPLTLRMRCPPPRLRGAPLLKKDRSVFGNGYLIVTHFPCMSMGVTSWSACCPLCYSQWCNSCRCSWVLPVNWPFSAFMLAAGGVRLWVPRSFLRQVIVIDAVH